MTFPRIALAAVMLSTIIGGCSNSSSKSPDVSTDIRRSLEQAGLKDVSVSQDRDKGVVTLSGKVQSDPDKAQADSIAKSFAGAQVVADEIAVIPPGASEVKTIDSDLDDGIKKNLDATLIQARLKKDVNTRVKNGVVTLTGSVNSQAKRDRAAKAAASVPNVKQVVDELEVKNQKATTLE